jgi:hypothetical protein
MGLTEYFSSKSHFFQKLLDTSVSISHTHTQKGVNIMDITENTVLEMSQEELLIAREAIEEMVYCAEMNGLGDEIYHFEQLLQHIDNLFMETL